MGLRGGSGGFSVSALPENAAEALRTILVPLKAGLTSWKSVEKP